jgi:hypothetical protein
VSTSADRLARRNVEVIIERLAGAEYRFHANDKEQTPLTPHVPPTAGAEAYADWLQESFGPLPLTLLSWVRPGRQAMTGPRPAVTLTATRRKGARRPSRQAET